MNDTKDTPNIDAVIAFLLGEAPLHGVWFGEQHPTEPGRFWWRWPLRSARAQMERTAFARQSAQQVASVPTRDEIRTIFLANGFTLKDNDDLRPYVYDAAYALIQRVLETPPISAAQPQAPLPRINVKCETADNGITGATYLKVIRVEQEDDGSLTVVIETP